MRLSIRWLAGWLLLAALLTSAAPARAQSNLFPPPFSPAIVPPLLFEGFPPIPPGPTGLSPDGRTLVAFDRRHVSLVRVEDGQVLFRQRIQPDMALGFTLDGATFIIAVRTFVGRTTVQLVSTENGGPTRRLTFVDPVDVLVNPFTSGIVLMTHGFIRSDLRLFNADGQQVFRQRVDPRTRFGFGAEALAILEPVALDDHVVRLVRIDTGQQVLRERVRFGVLAGFNRTGDRFLLVAGDSFFGRVSLIRPTDGVRLVTTTTRDLVDAGFTFDGRLLVLVRRVFGETRLEFYRAEDGQRVFGF